MMGSDLAKPVAFDYLLTKPSTEIPNNKLVVYKVVAMLKILNLAIY